MFALDKRRLVAYTFPVLLAVVPSHASALDIEDAKLLVIDRAVAHSVSPALMLCVVNKESRFQAASRGSRGERGLAQWLPGRGNAWDYTSAYRLQGIDIIREYERGNPNAPYFDVDGQAELFARGYAFRQRHWFGTLRGCE